jgi:methyl-accepting chemotaxis protein
MTVGKRIAGGFALVLAIFVLVGALAFWGTSELIGASRWVTHTQDVLTRLEELRVGVMEAEVARRGYLFTKNPDYLKNPYEAARAGYRKTLDKLRELTRDNTNQQHRLDVLDGLLRTKFPDPDGLRAAGKEEAAVQDAKQDVTQQRTKDVRNEIHDMQAEERTLLDQRSHWAETCAAITFAAIVGGTVLALVVGGLAAFLLIRSVNATFGGAIGQLASTGNELLASTNQQAAGAEQQAAAVAQTVATVDEVTQTADQAAQRAKAVGDAVQRTLETGKAGRKAVDDSLAAMDTVKEQVEATAENILTLAEQAQAIGDIIATVTDIAEQTNVLSLNAAIEASRAAEHGKGFAVVAGEVKALADQSKKATTQVRQILGEIQKATNTAVLSTEEVTKGVAAAIKVALQANETIKALADTLTDTARATTQIAASVGQQATGMAQIHQAMKNIDHVARQNTVATRQASQAAENLNTLGTRLRAYIGR